MEVGLCALNIPDWMTQNLKHSSMIKIVFAFVAFILVLNSVTAQEGSTEYKDLLYAADGSRILSLDLYMPAKKPNPYLVVWVHGGAWHSGSHQSPPLGLLDAGYALASVEYRRSTEAPFPTMIHDIKASIRFLRGHAGEYGYRTDKIAIWGASAGGHLAALAGVSHGVEELEGNLGHHLNESSSVQAIINFYGPTNLLTILDQSTPHGIKVRAPALALLLGKPVEQDTSLASLASPAHHVDAGDPPMFIAHGDQDIQVPINQSHEIHGAYKALGIKTQLEIVHGAGHTDTIYFEREFLKKVAAFLAESFQ